MATNTDYLSMVPLFRGVEHSILETFSESCVRKRLSRCELLFGEGSAGGAMYIILSGLLRVERLTESSVQILGTRKPGEVVGEMSLIDGMPRSAQVVAETDCKLLVVYHADFCKLILEQPTVGLEIMKSLSIRLRESADLLLSRETEDVPARLMNHLLRNAADDHIVTIETSQAALAELLGCVRETLNRAIKTLIDSGKIVRLSRNTYRISCIECPDTDPISCR